MTALEPSRVSAALADGGDCLITTDAGATVGVVVEGHAVGVGDVEASLTQQRKVKRMLRTKAQNEADRLGADVDALTAALVAIRAHGAGQPEVESDGPR
jgi:hypothetical protein